MEEQLISAETAKLAKEKGFKLSLGIEQQLDCYNEEGDFCRFPADLEPYYTAPTQSLLQKWLRSKGYEVEIMRNPIYNTLYGKYYDYIIYISNEKEIGTNDEFTSYEEALEAGLQEALKLIKT